MEVVNLLLLRIPWLGPSKNDLKGVHWSKYNEHKNAAMTAFNLAMASQYPGKQINVTTPVKITFRAFLGKGQRAYDKINYADCFKMLEDCAVQNKIIPDDRDEFVESIEIQSACKRKDWWEKGMPVDSYIMFEIKTIAYTSIKQ